MAIAYVVPRLEMGGTEKHVRDLIARLDKSRFRPLVIATSEGGVLESDFARMGVPVHVLGYKGLTRRRGEAIARIRLALGFLRTMVGILKKEKVAVVHAYLPAANVIGALAGLLARTPVIVVSKRGLCHYKKDRPVLAVLESAANVAADAILVNSKAVAEAVRRAERFCGKKIRLIHNGIDPEDFASDPAGGPSPPSPPVAGLRLPEGVPRILCVANLFPYKGHLDLVEAAALVSARHPDARFLLAGRDSGAMEEVRARIEALRLGGRVHLLGPRNDVPALLAAADVVVHPSHEEGFPNVILEAMAAGKAVVATNVGGIPELVSDGETAILVPPREPAQLAGAILSLLSDPGRAQALGEAGRRRVQERFPIGTTVREVEEMYAELLSGESNRCAG